MKGLFASMFSLGCFMKKSLFFVLTLYAKVGIVTAAPAVVLGLLGRYLDKRFGTSPVFIIVLMVLALGLTLYELKKIVNEATKNLNDFDKNDK